MEGNSEALVVDGELIWVCCIADGWIILCQPSRRDSVAPDAAWTVVLWPAGLKTNNSHNNIIIGLYVETS